MASSAKMVTKTPKLRGPSSLLLLPATTKMSWQRLRHGWPLLAATWLGIVALVTLVCAEPLFGQITIAAQVQDLARTSQDGPTFTSVATSTHLTAERAQQALAQVDQWVRDQLGSSVSASNLLAIKTPNLSIVSPKIALGPAGGSLHTASGGPLPGGATGNVLAISAYDPAEATRLFQVIAGRLPDANSTQLEIAISETTARNLQLRVGSQVTVHYPLAANSVVWHLYVVGIIKGLPAAGDFWHAAVTGTTPGGLDDSDGINQGANTIQYNALAARQVVLPALSSISLNDSSQGTFFLSWNYTLKLTNLDNGTINTLLQSYQTLENRVSLNGGSSVSGLQSIWLQQSDFMNGLRRLQSSLVALQIFSFILLCLTIGLALLAISTMAQTLVERQVAAIATMRSRGVRRGQIFWAFAMQGILLVLLAACVGPLLALFLVSVLATSLLSGANQAAAQIFSHNLSLAMSVTRWDILVVAILALLTLLIAINRATKIDIVTLRREAARTTQLSFWKRVHLDIILALLTCLGYGVYLYSLISPYAHKSIVRMLQELFSLIATPLILIAITLLFSRVIPLLFRLATRMVARSGSTPALLAFAQMERAPRATSRLLLLFVVALASACYLLSLAGTQQAWYEAQVNFQVGADFQGKLAQQDANQTLTRLTQRYSTIPGVQAASEGYRDSVIYATDTFRWPTLNYQLVDADTYASAALWSPDYSEQALANLMQNLKAHRAEATTHDVVYVYADASMWNQLDLAPGTSFSVPMPGYAQNQKMHFIVLGEITNIPGIATSGENPYWGMGILADYQSYATVYATDNPGQTLAPNMVWLRTANDPASLTSVRKATPDFLDRRALLETARSEPVHVNLLLIFNLGTAVALGLALLGMLIVSRASIASRRTNFAALRALGMAPRQIAAMLIWEHGVLYALALVLGLGLGWLLSFNVVPVFTLLSGQIFAYTSVSPIPNVPPIHLSFPLAQAALLFGGLLALNLLGLILMARSASRPTLNQVLRLNED